MAHLPPISSKKTTTTAIYNQNLMKAEITVRLDSFRSGIMCKQSDGSTCRPYITIAVDEGTGEVVYQSVGMNLMTPQEAILFLNQTKKHLEQSGKALGTVVVDISPTFHNQCFINTCSHSGISVCFAPFMAVNRVERYFSSLDMFIRSHTREEHLELGEVGDFVKTYAEQIYNFRRAA